jgi:hypothetical protein
MLVKIMAAALAHYAALGFDTFPYEGGNDYGFAGRDGVSLHLAGDPGHDPGHSRVSAVAPARSARPRTACAKAPTPTRTGT